jgi:hypothetical protein
MKIDFTPEQYELLIRAVYLGNWMVKSTEDESCDTEFDALEAYILSFAKGFGLGRYADMDDEEGKYFPSRELEEDPELDAHIQRYDDYTFWEKLIYNLARRDMERKYGERAIALMSPEEHLTREQPFIEKYEKEFEVNGLRSLAIKPPK